MTQDMFIKDYIGKLKNLLDEVSIDDIKKIINSFDETAKNNGTIYVIGNGGSAATASHMANDLHIGLKTRGIRQFNVISLADNHSVGTAIANDVGFENLFYMQIRDVIKAQDLLIAISCSGNSENITKAVKYAKEQNTTVIGLTGFDGGELKELSDINCHINTNKGEYGLVEDMHMILDHIIYSYYISLSK